MSLIAVFEFSVLLSLFLWYRVYATSEADPAPNAAPGAPEAAPEAPEADPVLGRPDRDLPVDAVGDGSGNAGDPGCGAGNAEDGLDAVAGGGSSGSGNDGVEGNEVGGQVGDQTDQAQERP